MAEPTRSGDAAENEPKQKGSKQAGQSVAKEDVNVENPGKRPRELPPAEAKPKKKAGKRLMDYTG